MTDEKPMGDREIVEEILHLQAVENQLMEDLKNTILMSQTLCRKLWSSNIPPEYVVVDSVVFKVYYRATGYGLPGNRYVLRPASTKSVVLCGDMKPKEPS